jgi:hypothetical protein
LLISLTKSDIYTQIRVYKSDKRQTLFMSQIYKNISTPQIKKIHCPKTTKCYQKQPNQIKKNARGAQMTKKCPETVFRQPETVFRQPETVFRQPETIFRRPETIFRQPETVFRQPETIFGQLETVFG